MRFSSSKIVGRNAHPQSKFYSFSSVKKILKPSSEDRWIFHGSWPISISITTDAKVKSFQNIIAVYLLSGNVSHSINEIRKQKYIFFWPSTWTKGIAVEQDGLEELGDYCECICTI